jgi:hypothetical protein
MPLSRFCAAYLSSTTTPALTTTYAINPVGLTAAGVADPTRVIAVGQVGVGACESITIFATVTQTVGGTMTGITLKAQVSDDGANPTTVAAANWTDIMIADLPTATAEIEKSVTGVDGSTVQAAFGTTSARGARHFRILLRSIGANAAAGESAAVFVVGN